MSVPAFNEDQLQALKEIHKIAKESNLIVSSFDRDKDGGVWFHAENICLEDDPDFTACDGISISNK